MGRGGVCGARSGLTASCPAPPVGLPRRARFRLASPRDFPARALALQREREEVEPAVDQRRGLDAGRVEHARERPRRVDAFEQEIRAEPCEKLGIQLGGQELASVEATVIEAQPAPAAAVSLEKDASVLVFSMSPAF